MRHFGALSIVISFVASLVLGGCAQNSLPYMQSSTAIRALNATGAGKIDHVVFIIQENRSFDNLFQGYPGADTVSHGKDSKGRTVKLQPESLGAWYVIDHSAQAMFAACNGTGSLPGTNCKMDGFDKEDRGAAPPRIPSTSTCRTKSRSRTSTWRIRESLPTVCSNRSSTRVSSRINISSPPKRPRRSIFPAEPGAAAAEDTTPFTPSPISAIQTDRRNAPVSNIRRLPTSSTKPVSPGTSTRALRKRFERRRSRMVELQRGQAHLPLSGVEEKRDRAELEVHHRRRAPASCQTSRGSRRFATIPITLTARRATVPHG